MLVNLKSQLKEYSQSELLKRVLNPIILLLTALAFLFSDFRYGAFTFADFILIAIMLVMLVTLQVHVKSNQIKILLCIAIVLIVNTTYSLYFNADVSSRNLITQSIKLLFYATTMVSIYNYINRYDLTKSFLTINKVFAFFSIIIGLYITLAIYSDGSLPYEGLWHFTRRHPTSYEFQGNPNIIRTRSFFSEPAHFGYYLNIILASILFNAHRFKKKLLEIAVIIIGILSTMSFSMIIIMGFIVTVFSIKHLREQGINWKKGYVFLLVVFIVLTVVFWEFLFITVILRAVNIISGTDNSATNRIVESWQYVADQSLFFGNGISHTPTITNNFAYILSDLGLIGFIPFILIVATMIYINFPMGMVIVMLNFSRGGYLAAPFWFVLLFFFLFSIERSKFKDSRV